MRGVSSSQSDKRPEPHRVCLVTAAVEPTFLQWGLDLAQVATPLIVFCTPSVAAALQAQPLPAHVELVPLDLSHLDEEAITLAHRLQWLDHARRLCASRADAVFWIDLRLCYLHLSLEFLYSDLLVRTLRTLDAPTCFLVPGYPMWSLFGGPIHALDTLLALPEDVAAYQFNTAPRESADPHALRRWNDHHQTDEPNLYLSVTRTERALHVTGDSHIYTCCTPDRYRACRANVLFPTPPAFVGGRVPPLLFSHHLGSVTLHRAGRPGVLHGFVRDYRIRNGDAVVWVFGEVDVRCHIVRQQEFVGRALDEVVDTLVTNFIGNMCAVQRDYPDLLQMVFAPIPPLDNPHFGSEHFPIHGSIEQRVACRALLVERLASACRHHGFLFLDIGPAFAGPRGDLPWDSSDKFCHLAPGFQDGILEQVFRVIDAADVSLTTEKETPR